MTQQQFKLDRSKSVALIMDFQNEIISSAASDPKGVTERAAAALQTARRAGIPVWYVQHRGGRFEADSTGAQIHSAVAPQPGDKVITKTKAGAFSTTGLDVMLREKGIDTLILMGVATSGCVLSTMRWATDINYKVAVIADACSDRDPEVHKVLTEKVFPRQGTVLMAQQFMQALEG